MAMRKKDFLAEVTPVQSRAVRQCLNVAVGDLWRAVRGKLFLTLPPRTVQLELEFDE
jgi:hypothetical protein